MEQVLKLNADYSPIGVISWMDALCLVLEGKADLVEELKGRIVRSVSVEFQMPAVIRLRKYVRGIGRVGCSRENVLSRDNYTCQYCGARPRTSSGKPKIESLTIDHVIPRAMSFEGKKVFVRHMNAWKPVSSWENLVCACARCNHRKGSSSLEASGLTLKRIPKSPDHSGRVWILLNKYKIPDEWKEYLPQDSEWRGYWEEELVD